MFMEAVYQRFDHPDLNQLSLRLERRLPPVRKGEGTVVQIRRMRLQGGIRFNGTVSRFVWQYRLAHLQFSRKFIFGEATLLDLNEADRMSEDYRWIQGALGLQVGAGGRVVSGLLRAILQLGLGRWQLGQENYLELGPPVARRLRGVESGYRLETRAGLFRRLHLQVQYRYRILLDQFEPTFRQLNFLGAISLGNARLPRWQLFAGLSREWTRLREPSPTVRSLVFQIGVGYLQLPRRRPQIPVY